MTEKELLIALKLTQHNHKVLMKVLLAFGLMVATNALLI